MPDHRRGTHVDLDAEAMAIHHNTHSERLPSMVRRRASSGRGALTDSGPLLTRGEFVAEGESGAARTRRLEGQSTPLKHAGAPRRDSYTSAEYLELLGDLVAPDLEGPSQRWAPATDASAYDHPDEIRALSESPRALDDRLAQKRCSPQDRHRPITGVDHVDGAVGRHRRRLWIIADVDGGGDLVALDDRHRPVTG